MAEQPTRDEVVAAILPQAGAAALAFVFALGIDLGSKVVAVSLDGHGLHLLYNAHHEGDVAKRLLLSLAALLVVYLLSLGALWRGVGRLWGAWIGLGFLLAGIAGNGLSHVLWSRGTPDFIWTGGRWVWNVADFSIGSGIGLIAASVAVASLAAAWRDRHGAADPT